MVASFSCCGMALNSNPCQRKDFRAVMPSIPGDLMFFSDGPHLLVWPRPREWSRVMSSESSETVDGQFSDTLNCFLYH